MERANDDFQDSNFCFHRGIPLAYHYGKGQLQYSAKSKGFFIRSQTVLSEELQRRSNCNQTMDRNQKKTSEHLKMLRNLSPSEDAKNYGMNQQEIQVMELHTRTGQPIRLLRTADFPALWKQLQKNRHCKSSSFEFPTMLMPMSTQFQGVDVTTSVCLAFRDAMWFTIFMD